MGRGSARIKAYPGTCYLHVHGLSFFLFGHRSGHGIDVYVTHCDSMRHAQVCGSRLIAADGHLFTCTYCPRLPCCDFVKRQRISGSQSKISGSEMSGSRARRAGPPRGAMVASSQNWRSMGGSALCEGSLEDVIDKENKRFEIDYNNKKLNEIVENGGVS